MGKLQVVFVLKCNNGKSKEFSGYPSELKILETLEDLEAISGHIEKEYRVEKQPGVDAERLLEIAYNNWHLSHKNAGKPTAFIVTSEVYRLLKIKYTKTEGAGSSVSSVRPGDALAYIGYVIHSVDEPGISAWMI